MEQNRLNSSNHLSIYLCTVGQRSIIVLWRILLFNQSIIWKILKFKHTRQSNEWLYRHPCKIVTSAPTTILRVTIIPIEFMLISLNGIAGWLPTCTMQFSVSADFDSGERTRRDGVKFNPERSREKDTTIPSKHSLTRSCLFRYKFLPPATTSQGRRWKKRV